MFQVNWLESAVDELTALWVSADVTGRRAITAASQEVDRRLGRDPNHEGESRSGGTRITFVPPLAVRFQVEADGQTVTVLNVRLFRRRSP